METVTHLDTHVALWLAAGDRKRLRPVMHHLRRGRLAIAPMVYFELARLHEIGRVREPADRVVGALVGAVGLGVAEAAFYEACRAAAELTWTRDPFDRLIVATAALAGARLLTADTTILEHFSGARWD